MPRVYVGMTCDVIHHGHINIIQKAAKLGELTIGLLTDGAVAGFKRLPTLTYNQREQILRAIKGVHEVVPQESWDYSDNIDKYRPDIMVHGSDWLEGPLVAYRERAIQALKKYGGELREFPYTDGISTTHILDVMGKTGTGVESRQSSLKRLLACKKLIRVIEAHSPISALIAENSDYIKQDGSRNSYDCFWSSSLTDSIERCKPDIEALDISERLDNIDNIMEATSLPVILDYDTGGMLEHFEINIKTIERLGISAVIVEDKTGLKKNSLLGNDTIQTQEDPEKFCEKIKAFKKNRQNSAFMFIARIESLILEKGMEDALMRSRKYCDTGADGIMIHSRKKDPSEVFEFANKFRTEYPDVPLVCVPSSYNSVKEKELIENGFNIVIYANHLMRASYPAMKRVAQSILENERSKEVDNEIISIKEVLELIPGTN